MIANYFTFFLIACTNCYFVMIVTMNDIPLDELVICDECHSLHRKIKLKEAKTAYCEVCDNTIYHSHENLLKNVTALSLTTLIMFVLASSFAIVRIEMNGIWHDLTLPFVFVTLFKEEFFVVGLIVSFLIFIIPMIYILLYTTVMLFFNMKIAKEVTGKFLIVLAKLKPWNMIEIFLISVLVALVKLVGYAQIEFGISFWALIAFIVFNIYLSKKIQLLDLWDLRDEIYDEKK